MKVGRYVFDRHGGKVVFFGRFVSVLRTYAAFLAGTNRMHWRKFLVYNAAGGIVWPAIYTFTAYIAGDALRRASGTINLALGGAEPPAPSTWPSAAPPSLRSPPRSSSSADMPVGSPHEPKPPIPAASTNRGKWTQVGPGSINEAALELRDRDRRGGR